MQVSGHHGIVAGIFYIIAQLSGACLGILLLVNYPACAAADTRNYDVDPHA